MLKTLKGSGESFTEVIERLTLGSTVLQLAGAVSKEEAAGSTSASRILEDKALRESLGWLRD